MLYNKIKKEMAFDFLRLFSKNSSDGEKNAGSINLSDISLYNTLTGKKEQFKPIKTGQIGMYHCGPTVYGYQHIGNYRAFVFADTLKRLFLYKGFEIKQIINITDVGHLTDDADQGNDKIEEGAKRDKKSVNAVIKLYTKDFLEGLAKLNINIEGTEFPKATEHIKEQLVMIQTLEEKGYTYKTKDGIYFDTSLFPGYGKLGKINLKGLEEGARVKINPEKKNLSDFALWKFSKPTEKRQQEWDSPWGVGFPGWHIECSAMSAKYLGHHFDIHTGGIDHIATHHNNEIAQSECTFGKPPANVWMHNAHAMIENRKISKSLGNVILIKNIIDKKISPLALRYWFLIANYKTQINFTWESLEAAASAYLKLKKFFYENIAEPSKPDGFWVSEFIKAWADDLDTPKAVATMWKMIKDEKLDNETKKSTLLEFDKLLGLSFQTSKADNRIGIKILKSKELPEEMKNLLEKRKKARKDKDWKKADELRKKIHDAGYEIMDTEKGAEMRKIS